MAKLFWTPIHPSRASHKFFILRRVNCMYGDLKRLNSQNFSKPFCALFPIFRDVSIAVECD